jgi:aldehyde oxidoreductase
MAWSAVMTAADIPGSNMHGVIPPFADQPVFADGLARHRGEAIAMVVGERAAIAALRMDDFPVTWEVLPHALTPAEALRPGAPLLHQNRAGNEMVRGLVQKGNVDDGLAAATHVIERTYSTPFIEHAYIEPEAGWAVRDGDTIIIHGSTQAPHMDREATAQIMALPEGQCAHRAVGVWRRVWLQAGHLVPALYRAGRLEDGRPCGIVYTRQESMRSTTKRHPSEITLKAGCDAQRPDHRI